MLGFEVVSIGDGEAVARFAVTDRVRQRFGLVHGGAYAALAEMIATEATVAKVHADGFDAMGTSNDTLVPEGRARGRDHRVRAGDPPRPHDVGVGGLAHRRRGAAGGRLAGDDRGPARWD